MSKITYIEGDATRPKGKGNKIIVHCCNAQGAMGAGVALALRQKWKQVYAHYADAIKAGLLKLGDAQLVQVEHDTYVANLVGQNLYPSGPDGIPLVYEALEKSLRMLSESKAAEGATIHMPRIGAGLAGGSWERIEKIIIETLVDKGFDITVYDLPTNSTSVGKSLQYNK